MMRSVARSWPASLVLLMAVAPAACQEAPDGSGIRVVRDIVYASPGGRALRVDLYLPAGHGPEDAAPGIVAIRGGAWRRGDKEAFGVVAAELARRGFPAASVEYRAAGEALFPAALEDVRAAVRWMRERGHEHGIDPEAIGLIGGSAGAHLAVLAAVEGANGAPGAKEASAVQAVVGMATPADLTEGEGARAIENFLGASLEKNPDLWARASPAHHVGPGDPPLLLIHGGADRTVPAAQAEQLAEKYEEAGLSVELMRIPGAPHAFWNDERWFGPAMERAAEFFRKTLEHPR